MGPRCVHSCLNDNVTIPNNGSPIYTLAMRDVVICTSGLDVAEKVCIHISISQKTKKTKKNMQYNFFPYNPEKTGAIGWFHGRMVHQ